MFAAFARKPRHRVPTGTFRDRNGNPVFLDPFTIPFGGNAIAVVNLEARIPLAKSLRAVPFYDGGNVFKNPREIFNPVDSDPNNVNASNLRAVWTHTIGLGFRLKLRSVANSPSTTATC